VQKGASPPAKDEKPSYRSKVTDLKPGELKAMLLEHRFFSSCRTVDTMGAERAWAVSFHPGHFFHSPLSFEHHVRAVRSDAR